MEMIKFNKIFYGVFAFSIITFFGFTNVEAQEAENVSGIEEIISAGLQSVCYQTCDLLEAMNNDGIAIEQLKVDGGMVANNWLLQFLADTVNTQVSRPQITETTALGAAFLAGLQSGLYQSQAHIKEIWQLNQQFDQVSSAHSATHYHWGQQFPRFCQYE